jgi:putative redox protein
MKATARRVAHDTFVHDVEVGAHRLTLDEPPEHGGNDEGPNPQELLAAALAGCTAITIEMYANRKGWDIGRLEVDTEYEPADRGTPTRFRLTIRLPPGLSDEQVERLAVIAAKCPVHRTLDGEALFEQRIESLADPA